MVDIRRGLDITKEFLGHLKGVVEDKSFQGDLDKVGSVAAMISLGLRLYERSKEKAKTEDEKAFSSLIKFTFECAQATLSNTKNISIKNIKSKEIRNSLFNIFVNTKQEDQYWISYYLPSTPLIREFKKLFREILEEEGRRDLVQDFMFDFNMHIEEKADHGDNDIFKQWFEHLKRKKKLIEHLLYTSTMIYKCIPVDNKYLDEYYVENNAVVAAIETWDKEDIEFSEYIDKDSEELKASNVVINSVNKRIMYGEDNNRYTIVAAPFGIGKTSLSTYIAATCASQYLEGKDLFNDDSSNDSSGGYIPVFVSLKDVNDDAQNHIERLLQPISPGQEAKKRNILLICDGLDEYRFEEIKLKQALDYLSTEDKYPNIKFLITTRLEAGMQKLHTGLKNYIRLLPFNPSQVNEFFRLYGTPQYSFEKISSHGLGDGEKRKPMFCWMIALNPNSEQFLQQSVTSSNQSPSYPSYLTMALLYQDFIHSLIRAKYKEVAKEFLEYYSDEKSLLRKIAALKQAYESIGEKLTVNKLIAGLKDFYGLDYSNEDSKERKNIFDLALTSYFYLSGQKTRDKTIDFIHKSFKEHLLAEYYIESLLDYNNRHYLNVGMPSDQTMHHLAGLLEIVINEDEHIGKQTDNFIMSLKNQHDKILKKTLVENTTKIFESEEIVVFHSKRYDKMEWNILHIPSNKYRELLIHRWLSLYILNYLEPKNKVDTKTLSNFITNASHTIPCYLKRLIEADLSGADLSGADLSGADLSGADLSGADLSRATLSRAKLSGADISDADLSNANFSNAKLSGATLFRADLSGADLSGADLSDADLSDANFSNAKLSDATLRRADLSRAILSGADLSSAVLSGADLSGATIPFADLFHADLSRAILRRADLSRAILRRADLSNADLSNADLSGTDLSGTDLSHATLSGATLSNAVLSGATLFRATLSGADLSRATLSRATLSDADLSHADLSGADLSHADLSRAILSDAKLSGVNLSFAILSLAKLSGAKLSDVDLSFADLSFADLSFADLTFANLSAANLSAANLSAANLSAANLSAAINLPISREKAKQRGAII